MCVFFFFYPHRKHPLPHPPKLPHHQYCNGTTSRRPRRSSWLRGGHRRGSSRQPLAGVRAAGSGAVAGQRGGPPPVPNAVDPPSHGSAQGAAGHGRAAAALPADGGRPQLLRAGPALASQADRRRAALVHPRAAVAVHGRGGRAPKGGEAQEEAEAERN
ncbi:hypothetical protein ON010_g5537 [Phytophthora cinnamomi]|nr:hypothetical protein ON010_g5537 [Phytophthora cinnamomi]